jgi:hypothetical protein
MLTAFWSGLGGAIAKKWAPRILLPATVFWAGGIAAIWWAWHRDNIQTHGWQRELSVTADWLDQFPAIAQALLLAGSLLVVVASAALGERITLPLLRLLEGYGWRPRRLRRLLVDYRRARRRRWAARVQDLAVRQRLGNLSLIEFRELRALESQSPAGLGRLEELRRRRSQGFNARAAIELGRGRRVLHTSPRLDAMGMPTRLGDVLRAAERRPAEKYGLDAVVCWYALWLLIPADTKAEIVQARSALDNAARVWLWGALFIVWTPWIWWAAPIAVVVPLFAYYVGIVPAAVVFGDLMMSAFDLHRFRLYDGLHLPRPASPGSERRTDGPRLTNSLWGGVDEPDLAYVDPTEYRST